MRSTKQTCAVWELLTIRHLAVARPTQGRLAQLGRFRLHNLTVARPTKGRLTQICYTVKITKHQLRKFHK
ncbi:hypothetical protein FWK35_00004956 [Aphis craccivora]|uniref:Uncharacterized protein n=1 Tax=Aphis craccivora TaxID=307492 RepID=A0A6G0ZA07_APHCR|nr:hypothetical protein FWK35_00004956 [Aphis craccivora]